MVHCSVLHFPSKDNCLNLVTSHIKYKIYTGILFNGTRMYVTSDIKSTKANRFTTTDHLQPATWLSSADDIIEGLCNLETCINGLF